MLWFSVLCCFLVAFILSSLFVFFVNIKSQASAYNETPGGMGLGEVSEYNMPSGIFDIVMPL